MWACAVVATGGEGEGGGTISTYQVLIRGGAFGQGLPGKHYTIIYHGKLGQDGWRPMDGDHSDGKWSIGPQDY